MRDEQQVYGYDEVEESSLEIVVDDVEVDTDMPMTEEEAWVYKILSRATKLKGVTIDRGMFLRTELAKKCPADVVDVAVTTNPQEAGISLEVIDELADAAISIETRKVAGLSILAGIPGGLALIGTIPADIAQYFAHSLRIEQKLAYLYGWESFLNDEDEVDDETMTRLILFLGVMMQVGGANVSLTKFATTTAKVGVSKTIQRQALTKTAWYKPLRKVLSVVGVKLTKSTFAETVAKGVPLLGGVVSGGLTYATFKPGAVSLKKYLRTLPQATGVVLSDEQMEAAITEIEEESKSEFATALANAGEKASEMVSVASEKASAVAVVAKDKAGAAAKTAVSGIKKTFDELSLRFERFRHSKDDQDSESAASNTSDVGIRLSILKELLEEGVITQEEYDEKKRQALASVYKA